MREDNFWDMGPTGPCGPCSEIFYDLGTEAAAASRLAPSDARIATATSSSGISSSSSTTADSGGRLHPLPKQCIDTGMGFERLCMILAGKTSIFDTDLYQAIIAALPPVGAVALRGGTGVHQRIIADHARACVFLVADGVRAEQHRPRVRAALPRAPRDPQRQAARFS